MVEKKEIYIPCFDDMRTLHIYLPKNYMHTKKHYPVLYMFDGHNLFYDKDATYGKSWGMKRWMDIHKGECIIVGLECNHKGNKRLEEFSPYDFIDEHVGPIHGKGKELLEWMTTDLKQWIDDMYRTNPSRKTTAIGGSSMGGLMALYAVVHYPNVYGQAAVISPFIFYVKKDLIEEINICPSLRSHKIYISWGSDEFMNTNELALGSSWMVEIIHDLLLKDAMLYPNMIYKGQHNEESWEKELDEFLPWLFA